MAANNLKPHEEWALEELVELLISDETGDPGQRNDDAVRLSIVCKILNLDVYEIIEKMSNNFVSSGSYRRATWHDSFKEHVDRVQPYLDKWVPDDNPALGTAYYINR